MKMKKHILKIIFILSLPLLLWQCDDPFDQNIPDSKSYNLPPKTYISLFIIPDTVLVPGDYWINENDTIAVTDTMVLGLDTTVSKQVVHWWGDDPDGNIIGYNLKWSYSDTTIFTTTERDTFYLPILTNFDIFTLTVQAMDNDSLLDPSPARISFPVINSPPEIEWKLNSLPIAGSNPNVTHKSFPHHSFFWNISDIDGRETITKILYALDDTTLNDTSNWQELSGQDDQILIENISVGNHRFFIKAQDIAGAYSETLSFPDPTDEDHANSWDVEEPNGDILLVNDYVGDQIYYAIQTIYEDIFKDIVGTDGYSVWEIGADDVPMVNPQNALPYSTIDIKLNLSYFSKVFWFSYLRRPHITDAALAFTQFVSDGGILFISNGNLISPDTTWTFTEIDSTFKLNPSGRLYPGNTIYANFDDSTENEQLNLKTDYTIGNRVFAIIPGGNSAIRYEMEDSDTSSVTLPYEGHPTVMIETDINDGKMYYMSVPLHCCRGNNNLDVLFKKLFEIE